MKTLDPRNLRAELGSSESRLRAHANTANNPATATPAKLASFASAPPVGVAEAAEPDADPLAEPDALAVLDPVALPVAVDIVAVPDAVLVTVAAAVDRMEPETMVDTGTVAVVSVTDVMLPVLDRDMDMELLPPPAWRENCSDWARMALLPDWAETRLIW